MSVKLFFTCFEETLTSVALIPWRIVFSTRVKKTFSSGCISKRRSGGYFQFYPPDHINTYQTKYLVQISMAGKYVCFFFFGVILLSCSLCIGAEQSQTTACLGYVPGQVLVKFDPAHAGGTETLSSLAETANKAIGADTVLDFSTYGITGLSLIALNSSMTVDEAVSYYSSIPGVTYAEPDYLLYADNTPDDPDLYRQWGLSNTGQVYRENKIPGTHGADIHALHAWDQITGNRSSTVAVMDSGVDICHPDLNGNLWANPVTGLHGLNLVRGEEYEVWDDLGHGTHCAGIIGMIGDNSIGGSGVNWNLSIASIKILNSEGTAKTSDMIFAILYASSLKFPIISCSIAGPFSNATYEAIQSSSSLVVASAGNNNIDTDRFPIYPACYNLPNVISVAATDAHDNLTWFSNYGNQSVHVAAPGQDIYSTVPSIYAYDPIWYAEGGNYSSWNITGTTTINTTAGYPNPPSIAIDKEPGDDEQVTLEMNQPVQFKEASSGDELYLHYLVEANSTDAGVDIEVYVSTQKKEWYLEGKIPCTINSGWKQGFVMLPDGMESVYYRLVISLAGSEIPVHMKLGSVGVGTRGSIIEPGYAYMDGTSMAAPFVSGIAAMIHGAYPTLSAPAIKDLIMKTADPIPLLKGKIVSGGRVNLSAALDRIEPTQNISMYQGWNFVSIPGKPAPGYDTARIFSDIDSAGHSVLTYHTDSTGWRIVSVDDPLEQLEGYWIYAKNQTSIPMVYLPSPDLPNRSVLTGWNAVGGWSFRDISTNLTFTSLGLGWLYVYGYDTETQQYDEVIIRGGTGNQSDSREVKPGRGYWLYARVNGTYLGSED